MAACCRIGLRQSCSSEQSNVGAVVKGDISYHEPFRGFERIDAQRVVFQLLLQSLLAFFQRACEVGVAVAG